MSSTRASSPAAESSPPTPSQLTPNSKVKALLANFDDSDDESISGSARARLASTVARNKSPSRIVSPQRTSPTTDASKDVLTTEVDDEDEDEDEDIVRPKGRLAARMLAAQGSSEEEEDVTAETARERVKKMLMTKPKSKSPEPASNAESNSDGNDSPVVSRKRKIRVARNGTPVTSPRERSASPGLFVSPTIPRSATLADHGSDSDELPTDITSNDRFKALVAKKRQERLEREAQLKREKAEKTAQRKKVAATLEGDDEQDFSDEDVEQRLTQSQRPTRRAGKKALEEMHRETQRLSRSMQLAHQAKTRKKITKASLFARFNYKPAGYSEEEAENSRPASSSSAAAPHSDVEMRETPPTSPACHGSPLEKPFDQDGTPMVDEEPKRQIEEELPSLEDLAPIPSSPPARIDKGKGKALEETSPPSKVDNGKGKATEESTAPELPEKKPLFKQRPIRIRPPKTADRNTTPFDDSDSDLEIVSAKKMPRKMKMDAIFDRVPAKKATEASSIQALRMLAHLNSPEKQSRGKKTKPSMTTAELQMSLQQRARQQATREREERLQALRDKGVIVQTAEEREKELAEVEDLIAKARREGEEIMKREKAAAKKERKAKGEVDPLGDSSDDEDWEEEKETHAEELSGSGSEDEELGESEESGSGEEEEDEDEIALDNEENAESVARNSLLENEAEESVVDEAAEEEANLSFDEEMAEEGHVEDEDETLPLKAKKQRARKANIISDDEDEEEDKAASPPTQLTAAPNPFESPVQYRTDSPIAPNSVLRSATKTFIPGLTVAGPAGLGLTQIFQGTMDDSQMDPSATELNSASQQLDLEKDRMSFLRGFPAPSLPPFQPTMEEDTQDQDFIMDSQSRFSHIPDSQPMEIRTEFQEIQLDFSQSQIHEFDSLVEQPMATQFSEFPEPTQDAGFVHRTPIRGRFVEPPPSTVETVVLEDMALPETMDETPVPKKKGKLRRRDPVATFSDEEDAAIDADEEDLEISANAFDVMRKASKKKEVIVDDFDRKKSKAKDMVNEQAEESEDEYAGLGGASDDESGGEDEYVKEMIDDAAGKDVDESKLAAFFADRERANDEKQVEKLYNDITKGMLRRKRGADYDLSDSDDGGEAKRRMKRKEFARMRKALLADERIGKIAENPKRQAFIRAIEDRGSDDEMDFLDDFAEQDEGTDSQSQSQGGESQQVVPDSQPDTSMGPPKRKRSDDSYIENRPPPHLRRTQPFKKPSNISEIRESLSSLIEEPNAMIIPEDSGSDSDELEIEGEADGESRREKENRDPFALRRSKVPVIDRISLKRASSNASSTNTRLAFAASSSAPGFKVPPLLRRATTNSSIASSTSSSVSGGMSATERMAGGAGSDGIKRGGSKNSGINYFARENERKAKLAKTEKKREQRRFKGAEVRRKVVGGLLGGGKFE